MRRTKRFASFALAACMGVSLLVNVPAEMVSAAEPAIGLVAEAGSEDATATDAGVEATEETSLEQAEEVVAAGAETSEADFVWDGTKIIGYRGTSKDVVIPSRCTEITLYGMSDGSLIIKNITIPASVTKINSMPFSANLESVHVDAANPVYDSRDNCNAIIEKKTDTLKFGCKNTTIPDGVKAISSGAFGKAGFPRMGCGIKEIYIPASVEKIEGLAFAGCDIERITVDAGNQAYDSRNACNAIIERATGKLIAGSSNTVIPSGVVSIGDYAFDSRDSLRSIVIPEGVTSIGKCAFAYCGGLANVDVPKSVSDIGFEAFWKCSALMSIELKGVKTMDTWVFEDCSALKEIIFSEGLKKISDCTFVGCYALKSIFIPKSVTEIGDSVFDETGLQTIRGYAGSYAETYARENGYAFEDITKSVTTSYRTHVQSFGWQAPVTNGTMSGTSGKAKRLEGIEISVSGNANLGIQYSTHCQTYGWLPWSANGEMNGTTGEAKRLEAIKIQLTGADKDKYDVYYRVHAQSYGWLGWAKNGAPSGTAGYAKRLEGIQIVVVKKGAQAPGLDYAGVNASKGVKDARAYVAKTNGAITIPGSADNVNVMYKTHVQSFGWQNWVLNGTMSGTSGKAKRLEGINIKLSNAPYAGGIQYKTHIQSFGWEQKWKKDGEMSGTSGKAKRLEAIQIQLYGEMAKHYDVYYRVHAQSYGWLNWAKNGEEAGTAGFAKRLEGIQIVLVPKGGTAPANNYKGIQSVNTKAYIKR